ncbi:MAG: hypothetical protein GQE15_15575 [Archangiaceae bacterium]|nr:hypothetical protein [Archangiaceae bacterium]
MRTLLLVLFTLTACGPMEDPDALPAVDETKCTKDVLEADGLDSDQLAALPAGQYVITTTYLRLPHKKSALKRFNELVAPMTDELKNHQGLVRVTTRLSSSCNTARTLAVWKSELEMYRFVNGASHAKAMGSVTQVSRGGSVTTHWLGSEADATWQTATQKLAADTDGPTY